MNATLVPDVLGYEDYRVYLRKVNDTLGRVLGGLVGLARLAGLRSAAALSMVINQKRHLSLHAAETLAEGLGLKGSRRQYFLTMVRLALCRSESERTALRETLQKLRGVRQDEHGLSLSQFRFLSRWYYAAIYAMADSPDFQGDAAWILSKLTPTVSLTEVKEALGDLQNLELLKKVDGKLVPSHSIVRTPDAVRSTAVRRYHESMIQLAHQSLSLPLEERDVTGLTLSFSRDQIPALQERIRRFRSEINQEFGGNGTPEQVFQVNIQFFPLSRPLKQEEKR